METRREYVSYTPLYTWHYVATLVTGHGAHFRSRCGLRFSFRDALATTTDPRNDAVCGYCYQADTYGDVTDSHEYVAPFASPLEG